MIGLCLRCCAERALGVPCSGLFASAFDGFDIDVEQVLLEWDIVVGADCRTVCKLWFELFTFTIWFEVRLCVLRRCTPLPGWSLPGAHNKMSRQCRGQSPAGSPQDSGRFAARFREDVFEFREEAFCCILWVSWHYVKLREVRRETPGSSPQNSGRFAAQLREIHSKPTGSLRIPTGSLSIRCVRWHFSGRSLRTILGTSA